MSNTFQPLDYPEIQELFEVLFSKVLEESGRGAILIVTAHIEDFLTDLVCSILPKEYSKNQRDKLLKYPGHLSSFSSKIELAYAFRIIDSNVYGRLNALRKIRNDAAHSNQGFNLYQLQEKMNDVYNFGPGFPVHLWNISAKGMIKIKMDSLIADLDKKGYTDEEKKRVTEKLLSNEDLMKQLEQQIPHWQLILGTCFLAGLILYNKRQLSIFTEQYMTWGDIPPVVGVVTEPPQRLD